MGIFGSSMGGDPMGAAWSSNGFLSTTPGIMTEMNKPYPKKAGIDKLFLLWYNGFVT